jgi:hypothetical protein
MPCDGQDRERGAGYRAAVPHQFIHEAYRQPSSPSSTSNGWTIAETSFGSRIIAHLTDGNLLGDRFREAQRRAARTDCP